MRSLTPKLQAPKIGKIELASADILKRSRTHAEFSCSNENHIVFSMQKKGSMSTASPAHLQVQGGDVLNFNRWPVPSVPWQARLKVTQAVAEKMFEGADQRPPLTDEHDIPEEMPTADEVTLDKDMVVLFPHEHSMQLGLELINVFGADVVMTTTVGSGELFKAVLQKHKFGIGVCKNAVHKKEVVSKLKNFVKSMNLVQIKDAPTKSAELLKYEQDAAKKTGTEQKPLIPCPTPEASG